MVANATPTCVFLDIIKNIEWVVLFHEYIKGVLKHGGCILQARSGCSRRKHMIFTNVMCSTFQLDSKAQCLGACQFRGGRG